LDPGGLDCAERVVCVAVRLRGGNGHRSPLVSLVTIIATIRTARRGWGFAIPLGVFALFSIDVVVLYLSFKP
jgi:hypothetical protein